MSEPFIVSQSQAVALCKAANFEKADKYNSKRLAQRVSTLDEQLTPDVIAAIEDKNVRKLAKSMMAAMQEGRPVEMKEATPEAPAADKPAKAKKGKAAEVPPEEKPAKKPKEAEGGTDKPAKEKKEKGPKVIETIAAMLKKATAKNPATKDSVLEALVAKFPDRNAKSMRSTINHQIPSYLKKAGHDVRKNDKGYWIEAS